MREKRAELDRAPLLGSIIVDQVPQSTEVDAVFEGRAELVSYTLEPARPARGDRVSVTFYWRALRTIPEDYWVFVHGDADGGGARRIFGDHLPAEAKYPMSLWREGDRVRDSFSIHIPSDYAPSRLALYVGLYLGDRRLPITDPGRAPMDRENRSRAVELAF
jgi:hypothetical protein